MLARRPEAPAEVLDAAPVVAMASQAAGAFDPRPLAGLSQGPARNAGAVLAAAGQTMLQAALAAQGADLGARRALRPAAEAGAGMAVAAAAITVGVARAGTCVVTNAGFADLDAERPP